MSKQRKTRFGLLAALGLATLLLAGAASASAAAPRWRIDSLANSSAAPGTEFTYLVQMTNVGDGATNGAEQVDLVATLPEGISGVRAGGVFAPFACTAGDGSSPVLGAGVVRCKAPAGLELGPHYSTVAVITVAVAPGASGVRSASLEVSGGAPAMSIVDPTQITPDPLPFGIDAFDANLDADPTGAQYTQAAGHPYDLITDLDFNTAENSNLDNEFEPYAGIGYPVEPVRDAFVDLPPGALGNPGVAGRCTSAELAERVGATPIPLCPVDSQIGTAIVRLSSGGGSLFGPFPLYNMVSPPGAAARLGFSIPGGVISLDAHLRTDGSYGISVGGRYIGAGVPVGGVSIDTWGVPGDPVHDLERGCPGQAPPVFGGPFCPGVGLKLLPFLRNTTACTAPGEGLPWSVHADSWFHPGGFEADGYPDLSDPNWKTKSFISHEAPGYPTNPEDPSTPWGKEVGVTGCEEVPFEPTFEATPTSNAADSPTGLDVDIEVPQDECWQEVDAICQSDLKSARVTLPEGMAVNPANAAGLDACSSSQIGLLGSDFPGINPIHFTGPAPSCPESSKIGEVTIDTPLLDHQVSGAVYLAAQGDNPFHSLLALYLVVDDPQSGVLLKLPGEVIANKDSGRLETLFDHNPQLPFSHLHLELKSGQRAPLINPPACGTYSTAATLGGWAGNPASELSSPFTLTSGPGGAPCPSKPAPFAPALSAGTQNPIAGTFSPFTLRLTREDASQRLAGLSVTLPPGLIGRPAGIPYCPDAALASIPSAEGSAAAQLANPSCPAASQIGTVTVGAGAGSDPFFVQTGRAYLAGPYKGAPLSLAVVTPALAGPFDLGNVVVRSALRIDQTTTQITAITDPLPTQLFGIPLDLRDLRVNLDRPDFTLNPTSCDEMSVGGTASGTEGATAPLSDRFQVANCDRLPFKPNLRFRFKGGTHRTDHPALSATLTAKPGEANIARAQVKLPKAAFLDNSHIKTICTRVQFSAHACPPASVYGYAKAVTPLLDAPLQGPVYLRSSDHKLPDLVADLNGQIEVAVAGKTDSVKGALRNTFELVPDAPVSSFHLELFGGKRGLIEMSSGFCAHPNATVKFDGQNGKVRDFNPKVKADCGKSGKTKRTAHNHNFNKRSPR